MTLAVPPALDGLFPPDDAGTTMGGRSQEPTPGTTPRTPDADAPAPAAPSPPPPAPEASVPPPAAAPAPQPAMPAAPPPPSASRRPPPARKTARATPAPAPPAAEVAPPAAVPSPEAPAPPEPSPSPAPPPPPQVLTLAVTCTGLEPEMERGDTFTMTYRIESPEPRRVGLGAALLDAEGDDRADGSADRASFELPAGTTTFSRPVAVHDDLSRREYEVVGALWRENEVGSRDAQPLREASCGSFEVVD